MTRTTVSIVLLLLGVAALVVAVAAERTRPRHQDGTPIGGAGGALPALVGAAAVALGVIGLAVTP